VYVRKIRKRPRENAAVVRGERTTTKGEGE